MTTFIGTVSTVVISNAATVEGQYAATGIALDSALTTPWSNATNAMKQFGSDAAIDMNAWISGGGFIDSYSKNASGLLTSPWNNAETVVASFKTNTSAVLDAVYKNVKSNVESSVAELKKVQDEINKINSTDIKQQTYTPTTTASESTTETKSTTTTTSSIKASTEDIKMLQNILNTVFGQSLTVDGKYGSGTQAAVKAMQQTLKSAGLFSSSVDGLYGKGTSEALQKYVNANIRQANSKTKDKWFNGLAVSYFRNRSSYIPSSFYAKGTLGTKKDEWAVTDEWGDELTLVPGKDGNLSFMRKGTAVLPADISENLMKLGMQDPSQMMTNSIIKPSLNNVVTNNNLASLNFDSLVHIDNCDESSIDQVKKIVNDSLNKFAKQLNYGMKRVGAY